MAEEGVFFQRPLPSLDPIDGEVVKQLNARQQLFAKKLDYVSTNPNFLQSFINGNNSFVKLTSGINILGDEKAAYRNILLGGTLSKDGKLRKGLSTDPFDGNSAAYNYESKEGYVPMPGIVDANIVNRGNSGFTREASITIRCFSLEQLSIIEKLYLRPGFKCLLEWGHVVYATEDVKDGPSGKNFYYNPTTVNMEAEESSNVVGADTLKQKAGDIVNSTQHNYDYMIGLIKNYDWSYDRDGYTLNLELLGEGAITTFVQKMHTGTSSEEPKGTGADAGVAFNSSNQSSFGGILGTINDSDKRGYQESDEVVEEADMDRIKKALDNKYKNSMTGIEDMLKLENDSFEFKVYRADFNSRNRKPGKNRFNYISFRFLLGMINYFFLRKSGPEEKAPDGKFNTTPGIDYYVSYPDHFSIDPKICLLPNQTGKYGLKTEGIISGDRSEDRGDIMDIHISTDFLYDEYQKLVKNESGKSIDLSVGAYLNNVLSAITTSLGGINQFTLYNDYYLKKELGPSKVVDLQLTPRPEGQPKNYTMIIPKGAKSFVKEFSFNSELSNSMINLIVNQAILTGVDASKATSTGLASFNNGIYSKIQNAKKDDSQTKAKEFEKTKEDTKKKLEEEFKSIFKEKKYDDDVVEKAYENGATLIQTELNDFAGNSKPKRGHIGAKVNIKMMGIGGLKALQFFKLPDEVLPESYYKGLTVGFQISNVSHDLANNEWNTTIEANAVILSQD